MNIALSKLLSFTSLFGESRIKLYTKRSRFVHRQSLSIFQFRCSGRLSLTTISKSLTQILIDNSEKSIGILALNSFSDCGNVPTPIISLSNLHLYLVYLKTNVILIMYWHTLQRLNCKDYEKVGNEVDFVVVFILISIQPVSLQLFLLMTFLSGNNDVFF